MKTTMDIAKLFVPVLNVPGISDEITGEVYLNSRPRNSKLEDIVVVPLNADDEPIEIAIVNINIHVPELENGTIDSIRLNDLTKKVFEKLESYQIQREYFDFDILWQQIVRDETESFANIRLEVYVENIN